MLISIDTLHTTAASNPTLSNTSDSGILNKDGIHPKKVFGRGFGARL
jgi:hypothetical protein